VTMVTTEDCDCVGFACTASETNEAIRPVPPCAIKRCVRYKIERSSDWKHAATRLLPVGRAMWLRIDGRQTSLPRTALSSRHRVKALLCAHTEDLSSMVHPVICNRLGFNNSLTAF